eukprot:TRINITY_DN1571_c0_g1_i5.p1 TRINITY_DN1571_c0_g1~~TRINITY_DN1571_c0_g1_i5.p1  ORF type:complete len:225 (-),score=36.30 TRINITY_DN1571_c0_g1_i5:196-870(-)
MVQSKFGVFKKGKSLLKYFNYQINLVLLFWVVGASDKGIEIWDLSTRDKIYDWNEKESFEKRGMCMDLKIKKRMNEILLFGLFENGSLCAWNVHCKKLVWEEKVDREAGLSLECNQECSRFIIGTVGSDVSVYSFNWEEGTLSLENTFIINHGGVNGIKIRKDQRIFATAGWDHRIRIFDNKKLKPLAILKGHNESVNAVDFSSHCNKVASGGKDGRILVWSIY